MAWVESVRMVPLATGCTPFEAKVLAARLGADGLLWELRGAVDSIYPIGEGVDVLVAEDELDQARELLVADEVDGAFEQLEPTAGGGSAWLVVVGVLLLVSFTVVRLVGMA